MRKLNEKKVLRDPVHGYIHIEDQVVWDCLNAKEFQRLRRIKQLGTTSYTYHTAEHSRFAHSLGVYEIVRRMVEEVEDLNSSLSYYEKLTVELAALLHDIGHAPFSHSFEAIMKCKHEELTVQVILGPSEVNDCLNKENPDLAKDVAAIIEGNHPNQLLCQLVSSQLDADRMDYLLRDSYFTGVSYGQFDMERILRTMRVADNKMVIKVSGTHTLEDYIMARYHMYWQVYYHPVSRSYDAILCNLFKRLKDLADKDETVLNRYPMYRNLLTKDVLANEDLFQLDDGVCYYSFQLMLNDEDKILADLANRLLNRHLFEYGEPIKWEELHENCLKRGYNPEYYLYMDYQVQNPYKPYSYAQKNSIWIQLENGDIREISNISTIVKALCSDNDNVDAKVFFVKEVL